MVPQESASKKVSCEWFNTAGFCPQTQKQEPTLKDSIFHSERERGNELNMLATDYLKKADQISTNNLTT